MTQTHEETGIVRAPEVDVAGLLGMIVEKGLTADSAAAVKELVMLHEHRQDRENKQAWVRAFMRVRKQLKTIKAEHMVPDKNGKPRWWYTPLEDLQDAVEPIIQREGMEIRFSSRREGNLAIGICYLAHEDGHQEASECAVNAINCEGGDLGAVKKGQTRALRSILGLKTRHVKDDAGDLGEYITPEQAEELEKRMMATGRDRAKFLKFVAAESFDKIRVGRYADAMREIIKAERSKTVPSISPTGKPGTSHVPGSPLSATGAGAGGPDTLSPAPASDIPQLSVEDEAILFSEQPMPQLLAYLSKIATSGGKLAKAFRTAKDRIRVDALISDLGEDEVRILSKSVKMAELNS